MPGKLMTLSAALAAAALASVAAFLIWNAAGPGANSPDSTTTPSPADTPRTWPDATTTGWARTGVILSDYTGPNFLKDSGQVRIDGQRIPYLQVYGNTDVIITRSQIDGSLDVNAPSTLIIEDSTVDAGSTSMGAISGSNIQAARVNVTGGQHSLHCAGNCSVVDSWLHNQYNPDGRSFHNNAFISNGGSKMIVQRNTMHCTATLNATDGGCTADLSLFGDFGPISEILVEGNLFKSNNSSVGYCVHGGHSPSKSYPVATGVRFLDNVFERGANGKCGVYGPVTSFQTSAPGNEWRGNRYSDGVEVLPAD